MYKSIGLGLLFMTGIASVASAQMNMSGDSTHVRSFENDSPSGWTIGRPHLDIAGGYFDKTIDGASFSAAFFRAHAQMGVGVPQVQISSDIEFVPKYTGAEPSVSAVLQIAPLSQTSVVYISGGIGLITGHDPNGNAAIGWVQAQLAIRTPIHSVALFGQIGAGLVSHSGTTLLLGVQHPLAPYKLHGLKA